MRVNGDDYILALLYATDELGRVLTQCNGVANRSGLLLRGTDDKGVYVLVVTDRFVHE